MSVERYFVAMTTLTFALADHFQTPIPELIERDIMSALDGYDRCLPQYRERFLLTYRMMAIDGTQLRRDAVPARSPAHKAYAQ